MPNDNSQSSFAFLVMTFNHENYILEHLESIKYQIENYGSKIDVDLLISDDSSSDQTRSIVEKWITINASFFRHVKTYYNSDNLGTCKTLMKMLETLSVDGCKMAGGDDLYSFENIFEASKYRSNIAMFSGRVLSLNDRKLTQSTLINFLGTATHFIYKNNKLVKRFKHFSYNNAPNLIYAARCLMHPNIWSSLKKFDVVEDWPIQIAIAREFPGYQCELVDKVFMYYRRTSGSAYVVARQRFMTDKLKIYDDLIDNETNLIESVRILIRKYCFMSRSQFLNKLLNLDFYIFISNCIFKIYPILQRQISLDLRINDHKLHYCKIQERALSFRLRYL